MITEAKHAFASSVASYVEEHEDFDHLSKHQVAEIAVMVLLEDIGAAQNFLDIIGVPWDLYEHKATQ